MSNFLRDLALQHQRHEGYFEGSLSYRNNNPGNLRGPDGAFRQFPSYGAGLQALEDDIRAKITNASPAMNRYYSKHGITYADAVFVDYINVYAPTADRNNPSAYCLALCKNLAQYHLTPATPLSVMAKLVYGQILRVPDPVPVMNVKIEERIKGLERRKAVTVIEGAKAMIQRVIERLRRRTKNP